MPKQRSITSSPPPPPNDSPKVTKTPPTPPAKVTKEKEEVEANVAPVPKQRPVPPKRPMKPRSVTDAPVTQPRPVPAPRRIGKEGAVSPAKEMPPGEEKNADIDTEQIQKDTIVTEAPSTQEIIQKVSTNDSLPTAPEDTITSKQEEKEEETVDRPESFATKEKESTDDAEPTETPPSTQPQKENKTRGDISTDNNPDDNTVSEHDQDKRHVSSADEYEHMKPGVTKDKCQASKKSPEYEDLDVCTPKPSVQPPQTQDTKYATTSEATKQKETMYAVPHVTGETNASVLATPQISVVASENEENLTTGSGKNSNQQQGDVHLQPMKFEIERDAFGVSSDCI